MASKREEALEALATVLGAISGPEFRRNDPEDREVPVSGRIDLFDGELGEPEAYLSPLAYGHTLNAEVVVMVQAADASTRDPALDALLGGIEDALDAAPTLGGLVEAVGLGTAEFLTEKVENGKTIKGARLTVALEYISDSPLG